MKDIARVCSDTIHALDITHPKDDKIYNKGYRGDRATHRAKKEENEQDDEGENGENIDQASRDTEKDYIDIERTISFNGKAGPSQYSLSQFELEYEVIDSTFATPQQCFD